jgi:predicted O-methyltransferase YrrM
MSDESTRVTAEHFRYVAARTPGDDELIRSIKQAATAEGIRSIWIAPEQASLIQILLKAAKVREVVEVGTLAGVSAISMARALPPDGRVRTIEVEPKHAAFARQWIAKSDVADRIEVILGAGMDVLPGFAADSADAAFLDADKASYPLYLKQCIRIVRRGGLILVDNAFAFGELFAPAPSNGDVAVMRAFNEVMAAEPALHSVIVPIGDGMWVGVKR